jgi:diguanylate cyclase (GGDEF)-like protein/PAS domain S-box-containing protein
MTERSARASESRATSAPAPFLASRPFLPSRPVLPSPAAATEAASARWRRLLWSLTAAVGCFVLALLGARVLPEHAAFSAAAVSAGLAAAAALNLGVLAAGCTTLGFVAALAVLGVRAFDAVAFGAAIALAAFVAARVLPRRPFSPKLERARDLGWFAGYALAVVAPLLAIAALFTGDIEPSGLLPAAATAAFAAIVVGTAALGLGRDFGHGASTPRALALAVASAVVAVALAAPWAGAPPARVLAVPVLLLLAVVLGGIGVGATGLAGVTLLRVGSAMHPGPMPDALFPAPATLAAALAVVLATLLIVHAALAELRWRAERWEWALDGSRLGVADWHLHRRDSFASAAWRGLAEPAPGPFSAAAWMQQVHPEDRPALQDAMARVAAGIDGRSRLELRLPHRSGWRWLEATLLVIERDTAEVPTRLLATLADVDDRRRAQERQRLSVSLFQHLHEGLLITDADLRVLDANPAYTQILGVPRDELIGSVPSLLRPAPPDPVARQQRTRMWDALRAHGSWRGELLERRRSGESCTLQATISTVQGPGGDLRYHVLVISDISEQTAQREKLQRQAHFDELTRLPNRARLSQLLDEAMASADRDGYLLVVCYLDLDRFKPVNDRFGHAAGDRLLAELAGRLRSALRSRGTWSDHAARLGGDEFVLLLRAGTLEEARLALDRVLRVVAQPYVIDPAEDAVQVTASLGATVYPIDRSDADTLLRHADHAMYGAKQSGRNGYLFFDPEQRRRSEERVMAIGRVQEALDCNEFTLHYQPKVDMRSGRVLGFEALLRWDHPQQGLIAPNQFLPLIENTGLSARVGDWVFARALEHLAAWRRAGLPISVSVNVSARHLQESDFAQRLAELLKRHEEPLAEHLEMEMLETAAHQDIEATSALLARVRALGVRCALDDFGTGYSTLTYLKRLPVDVLKIDRSFVHHMLDDAHDRAIVEGVIGLARTFGCTVVAEGVESPAQARTLLELGCDIGQGTGIAAPMPATQILAWCRDWRGMFALSHAAPPAAGAAPLPAPGGAAAQAPR